jgi:hypothetical protein
MIRRSWAKLFVLLFLLTTVTILSTIGNASEVEKTLNGESRFYFCYIVSRGSGRTIWGWGMPSSNTYTVIEYYPSPYTYTKIYSLFPPRITHVYEYHTLSIRGFGPKGTMELPLYGYGDFYINGFALMAEVEGGQRL